jgi:hypothetical protein
MLNLSICLRVGWISHPEQRTYPIQSKVKSRKSKVSCHLKGLERGEKPLVLEYKRIIIDAGSVDLDVMGKRNKPPCPAGIPPYQGGQLLIPIIDESFH